MKKLIITLSIFISLLTMTSCGKYSKECRGIKNSIEEIKSEIYRNEKLYFEAVKEGKNTDGILFNISYNNKRLIDTQKYYSDNCD